MIIRLILLLLGTSHFKYEWKWLALIGAVTAGFGAFMAVEASDGESIFIIDSLGCVLLVIGLVDIFHFAISQWDNSAPARLIRAVVFIFLGLVAVYDPDGAECWDALIIGIIFTGLGIFKIFFSILGRYPHWRVVLGHGVFNLLLGCLFFREWGKHGLWLIPMFFGCTLVLMGVSTLSTAWDLRKGRLFAEEMGSDMGALDCFMRYHVPFRYRPVFEKLPAHKKIAHKLNEFLKDEVKQAQELVVHIWTPIGSAENPVPGKSAIPLVSRYLMVHDEKGSMSIGHAAMELKTDLYVSHYQKDCYEKVLRHEHDFSDDSPLVERAKAKNEEGMFFNSHAEEVNCWMKPNMTISVPRFNEKYLRLFWGYYSMDKTYNLALRNCSVSVVMALDAALMGSMRGPHMVFRFIRLFFNKDMWVASFIRKRAEDMVWSPGLVHDYVMVLRRVFARISD